MGIGGAGLLLTGDGPTTYEAAATSSGMVWNYQVWAQGVGFTGVGVLDDRGGDDRYRSIAELTYDRTVDVPAEGAAPRTISPALGSVTNDLMTQGASWTGTGVLRDHGGGDDDYLAAGTSRLDVHIVDHRGAGQPAAFDISGYNAVKLVAQGAVTGSGVSALIDDDGSDVYVARSVAPLSVTAEATIAPRVTARSRFLSFIYAQGAANDMGAGILADLGGTDDRLEAEGSNTVHAPQGSDTLRSGNYWPPLQGSGGRSRLLALGDAPVLLATPRNGVCPASPGVRGFGTWVECSSMIPGTTPLSEPGREVVDSRGHEAVGHAPAAVGSPGRLTLEAGTPTTSLTGDRVPVTVLLTDDDGLPLGDRLVHVNFQFSYPPLADPSLTQWWNWWQEDAVTGPDGLAHVSVPQDVSKLGTGSNLYRLAATFDGEAGRHPVHAAIQFTP